MTLRRIFPGFLIGLITTLLLLALRIVDPTPINTLRGAGFDTLQRIWPRQSSETQPVRVVDIDEASLKKLGQWPWPRSQIAKLVDELQQLGAAAIVFDIIFPEPDRMSPDNVLNDTAVKAQLGANIPNSNLPNYDIALAEAIKGHNVILAFANEPGAPGNLPPHKAGFAQTGASAIYAPPHLGQVTRNLEILDQAAAGIGSFNIDLATDQGIARQIPLLWTDGKTYYPSLVLESLRVAQGADTFVVNGSADTEDTLNSIRVGDIEIPVSESGQFPVYFNHNDPSLYLSASLLLGGNNHETLRPQIAGHIVLIGTSAIGLVDNKTSPLGESIPGVSIHAQALQQIMAGAFLKRPIWAAATELVFICLSGIMVALGMGIFRPLSLVVAQTALLFAMAATVAIAFKNYGLLLDLTFPFLAVTTIFLSTIAFRLLVTDREGRKLRNVFSHYVAPSVLAEIESNPKALKLGGETRDVTVMFVDIQNFTNMGESLKPEALVQIVNEVLSTCSAAILANGGTIDKYIGDAVMAFWNAPIAQTEHQYLAAKAATEIQTRMGLFNADEAKKATLQASGLWPVVVRIGLASGNAVVGNMGSLERFDYSVLGETVNMASRAEGICKQVGHNAIIAGGLTLKTLKLAIIPAGSVTMRGKTTKTPIHLILGNETFAATSSFQQILSDHAEITAQFTQQKSQPKAIQNLINQAAARNPIFTKLFKSLLDRAEDYRS